MAFFDSRYKFRIHILQIVIVLIAIGVSAVKLFTRPKGAVMSRAGTMALGVGAKSLVIITYQLLTEHKASWKRWASLKANMILNCLEVVFWAAVVFMMIQANLKSCTGTQCYLSWAVAGIAALLAKLAAWTAVVSIMEWRYFKATGVQRGVEMEIKGESESESVEAGRYQRR